MKLLLESEVAAELRCSKEKIKRLRLSGALPYAAGRPVLIKQSDLDAYKTCLFQRKTTEKLGGRTDKEIAALARRLSLRNRLAKQR